MTRVKDFYQDLQREYDFNTEEIFKGILYGNIELPSWADALKKRRSVILFDKEEGDEAHWSAIHINNYCTQNYGECGTCSLVNYGRDCQNNPL
jgi:hypothetical protein